MDLDGPIMANPATSRRALLAYALPYLVWIAFLVVFQLADSIGNPLPRSWAAPSYALKSVLCAALLLALRPWRFGERPPIRPCTDVWPGLGVGLLVALLWILPESPFFQTHARPLCEAYNRWLVMPLGDYPGYYAPPIFPQLPDGFSSLAFSPAEAGWPLTVSRLLGSAFVIAVAEEYFFRGLVYRWIRANDFTAVPLARYDAAAFWIVVGLFAIEHDRWFMGAVAGIAYGLLAIRSGRLRPAIVAHVTTNLVLGIYVLVSGQYGFW